MTIMTYKHRKICDLLPAGTYSAEIISCKIVYYSNLPAMVVEFKVFSEHGELKISSFFYDSDEEISIKKRKQFFKAISHPEYFDMENFNIDLIKIKTKLILKIKKYIDKETNEDRNTIQEYLQEPFPNQGQQQFIKELNDDITF